MKDKSIYIALVLSIIANAVLTIALGNANDRIDKTAADLKYVVDQRLAVLEVEQFIRAKQPKRNVVERRGYAELIVDAAAEFGKPPLMVARVALAESSLDHRAIGDGGDSIGAMQVSAKWWVGVVPFVKTAKDLRDPQTNIRAGAWILRHYAGKCGTEPEMYLACYNGGENPNEQARAYAKRVSGGAL